MPTAGKKSKYEAKKGWYKLVNPHRYTGKINDNGEIIYKSTWEQRCFYFMDTGPNTIEWSNETLIIPYLFTVDGKVHRYMTDIFCKMKLRDGSTKTFVIEIKPLSQTMEPTRPKNRSLKRKARYEKEMYTFVKNKCKWDAANEYCKKHNYEFRIITEQEIYGQNL